MQQPKPSSAPPATAGELAALLGAMADGDDGAGRWTPQQLADATRYELQTPLASVLRGPADVAPPGEVAPADVAPGEVAPAAPHGDLLPLLERIGGAAATVGDLLAHLDPPLELLRRLKDFAKVSDKGSDEWLPPEVATALYYAAIAAALLRHRVLITDLPAAELRRGMEWAAAREWVGAEIQGVLVGAKSHLP